MFSPQYRITELFLKYIEEIAAHSARINAKNIRVPLITRLQREALERNVHASTSIEGNRLTLEQVSSLYQNRDIPADISQKQEVLNYIAALRWIIKNPQRKLTKATLLRLHILVGKNLFPEGKLGVFKQKQNYVINEKKIIVYTPPSPRQCVRLIEELLQWANANTKIHPIITSAIFHHQFVTIHPFSDGNGRAARAAAQWILYQRNFDPRHILALDDFYAQDRKRYYEKIQQARELDYDFTYWIEYVAEGILQTLRNIYERLKKLSYTDNKKITLTPKQEELINIIYVHPGAGSQSLSKLLSINRARVHQLISPLITAKIIRKEGSARATKYYLSK